MDLRPYQQQAYEAAIAWVKRTTDPCLIHAPTGSGKSHVIAAIAETLNRISGGKHVLCMVPSAELVTQNREKFLATGNPASIFSATAGGRSLRHPVVFATPGTVKNQITRFGNQFCAVVLDEAHRITPTIKAIIAHIQEHNPNLRVIGLSATPYRLGDGYIYAMDEDGKPMGEHACRDPYFTARVFTIHERDLIRQGFLTTPVVGTIGADHYETLSMAVNSRGQFDAHDVDQAFHGHGRKTSRVVADVVAQSRDRQGVMIFAATVHHAEEVMASLPRGLSALITGATKKDKRAHIIARFKAKEIKYLVNVSVLTTGFDAPHVDVIAILRATESISLLQQIIGRGMRIDDGKEDVLLLDYAENVERHCPDGDLFSPEVRASFKGSEAEFIEAECPLCKAPNEFSARRNDDGFEIDKWGYFLDLAGNRIKTDHGDMPAHYGRRCHGLEKQGPTFVQCSYRWTLKECPHCFAENDIAAKYCSECRGEIVDPNEKLRIEFKAFKKDPTRIQTDRVIDWDVKTTLSRRGNECIVVTYTTEYRSITVWYHPYIKGGRLAAQYNQYVDATDNGDTMPETITYAKDASTGFYNVYGYGDPADEVPA